MNANEVIANLALEKLGFEKGRYDVLHPNDHVNASQSTNDVYPTARAPGVVVRHRRAAGLDGDLRRALRGQGAGVQAVLKIGRTQLQDAVPMTLGQEFFTYAMMIEEDEARLREARALIQEVNLGATAIGTGINAPGRLCADVVADAGAKRAACRWCKAAQPGGGDAGHRRFRAAVGRAQARGLQAEQDLQRPAPAVQRAAGGLRRHQAAAAPGRLVDHAGQGQPGDPGGDEPGGVRGDRQRHHGDHGVRSRASCSSTPSSPSWAGACSRASPT